MDRDRVAHLRPSRRKKRCEEYQARAKEKGHRVEMMLADGVGHGFFNKTPWQERTLLRWTAVWHDVDSGAGHGRYDAGFDLFE